MPWHVESLGFHPQLVTTSNMNIYPVKLTMQLSSWRFSLSNSPMFPLGEFNKETFKYYNIPKYPILRSFNILVIRLQHNEDFLKY